MTLFFGKTVRLPKWVVDFLLEKARFRKNKEIVVDFVKKSCNNNGKPLKSPRVLGGNLQRFFHFSFVHYSFFII